MKKISLVIVILALFVGVSNSTFAAPKKTAKKTPSSMTIGKPVALSNYFRDDVNLTKEQLEEQLNRSNPIALMVGTGKSAKLYFLINEGGNYGGAELVKYALYKKITVYGSKLTKGGINYIVYSKIVGE